MTSHTGTRAAGGNGPIVFFIAIAVGLLQFTTATWGNELVTELPKDGPLKLRDVYFQALPMEVINVRPGSDGRFWLQLRGGKSNMTVDEAKKLIAEQFDKPTPRMHRVYPAFFEPDSKRVWFQIAEMPQLIGYDGTTWIDREPVEKRAFRGGFNAYRPLRNVKVDGKCFFPDGGNLHVFDGANWDYKRIAREGVPADGPVLFPDEDGKGMIAVVFREATAVWRYREGQWKEIDISWAKVNSIVQRVGFDNIVRPTQGTNVIKAESAARDGEGVWLAGDRTMIYVPTGETDDTQIKQLVQDLGNDDFAQRESATKKLVALGDKHITRLKNELKLTRDAEVKWRIEWVLEQLHQRAALGFTLVQQFGPYVTQEIEALWQDHGGNTFLLARQISDLKGNDLGGGLITVHKGIYRFFTRHQIGLMKFRKDSLVSDLDTELRGMFVHVLHDDFKPLWAGGSKAWIPGAARDGVRLLDLEAGTVIATTDPYLGASLSATLPDGSLVSCASGGAYPVSIYRPQFKDDRQRVATHLKLFSLATAQRFALTDEGNVWAWSWNTRGGKFVTPFYFDGQKWTERNDLKHDFIALNMQVGNGDNVLMLSGGGSLLRTQLGAIFQVDGKVIRSDNVFELIEDHRDAIVENFTHTRHRPGSIIIADADKNIWVRRVMEEKPTLRVLIGDKWIDAGAVAREAIASSNTDPSLVDKVDDFEVEHLIPIGDGKHLLAHGKTTWPIGTLIGAAAFVSVQDGKVVARPAPYCYYGVVLHRELRDSKGRLIINSLRGSGASYAIAGPDDLGETKAAGSPRLVDSADNVWMVRYSGYGERANSSILIQFADGRKQTINDTYAIGQNLLFFQDKPGSVYVWTPLCLLHYQSDDPRGGTYTMKAMHLLDHHLGYGDYSNDATPMWSPKGFFVCSKQVDDDNELGAAMAIQIIPVPGMKMALIESGNLRERSPMMQVVNAAPTRNVETDVDPRPTPRPITPVTPPPAPVDPVDKAYADGITEASRLVRGGRKIEAVNMLKKLVEDHPDHAQAALAQRLIKTWSPKDDAPAGGDEKLSPEDQRIAAIIDRRMGLARIYVNTNKKKEAIELLEALVKEHGTHPHIKQAKDLLNKLKY